MRSAQRACHWASCNEHTITHELTIIYVCCTSSLVCRAQIPKELHHTFDFIVIDPPFITAEVWADYAKAAKMLLVEGQEVRGGTDAQIDDSCAWLALGCGRRADSIHYALCSIAPLCPLTRPSHP